MQKYGWVLIDRLHTWMTNSYRQLISKGLEATLKNIHASFIQISRKEFLSSQRFIRMRSMVYKSEELELTCRESQVKCHSLCYVRTKNKPKLYYAASTTFRIPPSELERFYTGLAPIKANPEGTEYTIKSATKELIRCKVERRGSVF